MFRHVRGYFTCRKFARRLAKLGFARRSSQILYFIYSFSRRHPTGSGRSSRSQTPEPFGSATSDALKLSSAVFQERLA